MMVDLMFYILVVGGAGGIVWYGSDILEASSEELAAYYELPPVVQGAVIAAIGSSFPELSTTVISALLHGEFEIGVATIVGSAIFNILVIPAIATLVSEGVMDANRDIVYKEAQFYMLSVSVLLLVFSFAIIYAPVPGKELVGLITRGMAIIPVCLYGLYVFIQYQDTIEHDNTYASDVAVGWEWMKLVLSLVLIAVGVDGLVRSAIGLESLLGVPGFIWGLTVIAIGTSLPDLFVSMKAAREGRAVTSLSNVLGSNTFDLLVAIPAGVLIAGSTAVSFGRAAPMMAILTVATILLFVLARTGFELTDKEAWILLFAYILFVVWMIMETVGVVSAVF